MKKAKPQSVESNQFGVNVELPANVRSLLQEAFALKVELESYKFKYQRLDEITEALQRNGFLIGENENATFQIIDNFATKNVVFRPAGVRRFELEVVKKTS